MEFNKVFAAILVAGIVAMLSGFVAEKLSHPHKLKENAFPIEGVEVAGGGKIEKLAEPILAMLATADLERGQKLSKACAACHSFDKGGANGVGPNLYNIVGAQKQSHAGYKYSGALNAQGINEWNYVALNKFLWKPKKYAPGTKMSYAGLKKPEDRAAMVAWLRTLADSPKALPGALEIAAEQAELAPPSAEQEELEDAIETVKEGVQDAKADAEIKQLENDVEKTKADIETKKAIKKQTMEDAKKTVKDALEKSKDTH